MELRGKRKQSCLKKESESRGGGNNKSREKNREDQGRDASVKGFRLIPKKRVEIKP